MAGDTVAVSVLRDPPEPDPLARKWRRRIEHAKRFYRRFHDRVAHNRSLLANVDEEADADSSDYCRLRTNLIQGTVTAMLPNIYAKNPEISVTPVNGDGSLKLFCRTVEKVVNRYLDDADLKTCAKSVVRAALTASFGVLKVSWQEDMRSDPLMRGRIADCQDNLLRVDSLLQSMVAGDARQEQESVRAELADQLAALGGSAEVRRASGIVLDRVLTEHLLVDPAVVDFWEYASADWMVQVVPMRREAAETLFGFRLDGASVYGNASGSRGLDSRSSSRWASGRSGDAREEDADDQVCIYEIWDRTAQRVYTMADGCDWWLRQPFSPKAVGERWFPFFLLPFQTVDGVFIGPSLVDLLEKLQEEYNTTRERFNAHRDLVKPGYVASMAVDEKSIRNFATAQLGEITLIETEGSPVNQVFLPKQHPPLDASVYDTSVIRTDWEQVSGLQDAARSTVVKPKTATEANIMQQSLSGRVAEFRDQVEDFLQGVAQYVAEILLLVLERPQVERITGRNQTDWQLDEFTGELRETVVRQVYDWPDVSDVSRDWVFDLVALRIRAGTTGMPNRLEEQENWLKLLQVAQPLVMNILSLQSQRQDASALVALLRETLARFDDRLDVADLIPENSLPKAA